MARSSKGSSFEREFCTRLSLTWSKGKRDDIFWRTSQSGGRATARRKKGKATKNQYGDICAVDPVGQPFMDLFTVELKRGYSKHTIADLLDKPSKGAKQKYETWIESVMKNAIDAGTPYWLLVVKRDRRDPVVFYPGAVNSRLLSNYPISPMIKMAVGMADEWFTIHGVKLEDFLKHLDRGMVEYDSQQLRTPRRGKDRRRV